MIRAARLFILSFIAVLVVGCQVIPSPDVRAFGDHKAWMILGNEKNRTYIIGNTEDKIVVPKGFVTDYASIPQVFWSTGLAPHQQYSRAAVFHDYLYWSQVCTREQADNLFFIGMKETSVGWFDRWAVYLAVDVWGENSWDKNTIELKDEWPRIVPAYYQDDVPPNDSWPTFRKKLKKDGIEDPPFVKDPSYCKHGNSREVPE